VSSGILLRVGIDSQAGKWNAPCRDDGRFCYVPIPDGRSSNRGPAFDRHYSEFEPYVKHLGVEWPIHLSGTCHLDPDFSHLTYGDGNNRGQRIRDFLAAGDFIVFWSGLRSVHTGEIVCSIVGFYTISSIVNASEVGPLDSHRNAHTRYDGAPDQGDVVVFANPAKSGRLWKHIPIGKYRDRAQRVDKNLLDAWGDLENGDGEDWLDGYIQLSGAPPIFRNPARFLKWFWARKPKLVHANNV
jgi:hypothetical protein